jgi:hypothetical protein
MALKQSHEVVTECRLVSPNSSPHNHCTNHAPLTGIPPPAGQFATGTGSAENFPIKPGGPVRPEACGTDVPLWLFVAIARQGRDLVE